MRRLVPFLGGTALHTVKCSLVHFGIYSLSKLVFWLLARTITPFGIWCIKWVSPSRKGAHKDGSRASSGHRPAPCGWSGGASGCRRLPSPGWHQPSAPCRGPNNMSISWLLWFCLIALPRLPFARTHWQSAGYRGVSSGFGSPSWNIPYSCRSVGAEGGMGSRLWAPSRKPPWLP